MPKAFRSREFFLKKISDKPGAGKTTTDRINQQTLIKNINKPIVTLISPGECAKFIYCGIMKSREQG
jgi:hypothetical protein